MIIIKLMQLETTRYLSQMIVQIIFLIKKKKIILFRKKYRGPGQLESKIIESKKYSY